jgi:hypothetical protein
LFDGEQGADAGFGEAFGGLDDDLEVFAAFADGREQGRSPTRASRRRISGWKMMIAAKAMKAVPAPSSQPRTSRLRTAAKAKRRRRRTRKPISTGAARVPRRNIST